MSVMFDYFVCPSSEAAAAVIDWPAGPAGPPPSDGGVPPRPDLPSGYPTMSLSGIEPVVMMASLEALMTGRDADAVMDEPGWEPIAERDDGELLVVPLRRSLQEALSTASEQELRVVATPWSETEELDGDGDPEILAEALIGLAALTNEAARTGGAVYCWVCV
jgi:hypothetical protein